MNKPKADWLSWILQLIFGCFAGAGIGLVAVGKGWNHPYFYGRNGSGSWLEGGDIPLFVIGMGLFMGASFSNAGNSVWAPRDSINPDKINQSKASKLLSLLIGITGLGLMIFAVLRTYGWLRW